MQPGTKELPHSTTTTRFCHGSKLIAKNNRGRKMIQHWGKWSTYSAQNFGILLIPQNSADRQCQNCRHTPASRFGGERFLGARHHPGSAFLPTVIQQFLQKVIYAVAGLCVRDSAALNRLCNNCVTALLAFLTRVQRLLFDMSRTMFAFNS
jgi:hypothetical protein